MAKNAVVVSVLADTKQFASGMKGTKGVLAGVATAAAAAAAALGGAAYAIGKAWDNSTDTLITGTGASGKALEGLQDSVKAVGRTIPVEMGTATDAIAALNTATGATGEGLEHLTSQVLDASRMLGEDGVANAKAYGQALNQWSMDADAGADALDGLFTVTQDYGSSLTGLVTQLNEYGSVLQNAGFSMEESAVLFGSLQKSGLKVSRLMPGLNLAFRNWATEGKNVKEELAGTIDQMKNAETSTEALSIAAETFGAEGAQRLTTAVRNGSFSLEDLQGALEGTDGAIAANAKATNSLAEQWQIFKNRIMAVLEPVGTAVFDTVNNLIGPALDKFAGWLEDLGPAIEDMGGFVPILADLASNFSPLGAALQVLKPLLPPLVAAFSELGDTLGGAISEILPVIGGLLADIATALLPLVPAVAEFAAQLVTALVPVIEALVPIVTLFAEAIAEILPALLPLIPMLLQLVTPLLQLIPLIVELATLAIPPLVAGLKLLLEAFGPIIKTVVSALLPVIQAIVDGLSGLLDFLIGVFTGDWDRAWEGLKKATIAIWDTIVAVIKGVVDIILSVLTQWWQSIVKMGSQLTDGLARALVDGWRGIESWFRGIPGAILSFFSGVGTWLLGVGENLIRGLGDGIAAMGQWVLDQIGNVIDGAIGWAKSLLGINSPSRVFRDFGMNVGQGLADGIASMSRNVKHAAGGLSDAVTGGFGTPSLSVAGADAAFTGGRPAYGNTYQITVQAVAPSAEVGRAVVTAIEDYERLGGTRR